MTVLRIHDLTAREIALLSQLRIRDHRSAPCWLVDTYGGRYALIVPVGALIHYERRDTFAAGTVASLHKVGHITYGRSGYAPMFVGRRLHDRPTGCAVILTKKGRTALELAT